jgi:hypothetical protein
MLSGKVLTSGMLRWNPLVVALIKPPASAASSVNALPLMACGWTEDLQSGPRETSEGENGISLIPRSSGGMTLLLTHRNALAEPKTTP